MRLSSKWYCIIILLDMYTLRDRYTVCVSILLYAFNFADSTKFFPMFVFLVNRNKNVISFYEAKKERIVF